MAPLGTWTDFFAVAAASGAARGTSRSFWGWGTAVVDRAILEEGGRERERERKRESEGRRERETEGGRESENLKVRQFQKSYDFAG